MAKEIYKIIAKVSADGQVQVREYYENGIKKSPVRPTDKVGAIVWDGLISPEQREEARSSARAGIETTVTTVLEIN